MDLNLTDSSLKKKYIYADRQILAQHDIDEGEEEDFKYFYLHDRLGSVRLVIDDEGGVQNYYTYEPFGQTIESGGTLDNPFRFTGQYFDSEIEEYYLRARQYNPQIGRFTSRDPFAGKFKKPLTLDKYLYCQNDPVNNEDPSGKWAVVGFNNISGSASVSLGIVGYSRSVMTFYGVEDGTYNVFFGAVALESKGISIGIGVSAGFSFGFSENAQCPEDLAGRYRDMGFSVGPPGYSVGYSHSMSYESGIHLDIMTVGIGVSTWEFHPILWGESKVLCSDSWGD